VVSAPEPRLRGGGALRPGFTHRRAPSRATSGWSTCRRCASWSGRAARPPSWSATRSRGRPCAGIDWPPCATSCWRRPFSGPSASKGSGLATKIAAAESRTSWRSPTRPASLALPAPSEPGPQRRRLATGCRRCRSQRPGHVVRRRLRRDHGGRPAPGRPRTAVPRRGASERQAAVRLPDGPVPPDPHAQTGGPNQVVRASRSPWFVPSPTHATCPSGRINTAVGDATAPSTGSSHPPV
jgi:hypothetical protein